MSKMLICPLCGGEILEHTKSFSCSNWKRKDGGCKFTIWKNSYGAEFNEEDVAKLLAGENVEKTNLSMDGEEYQALWFLNENHTARFRYAEQEDEVPC